jgi:outer membrane protein TolC
MVKTVITLLTATISATAFAQTPKATPKAKAKPAAVATPAPTPAPVVKQATKSITLSQKTVAELILKQGYKTKETNYTYEMLRKNMTDVLRKYDWQLDIASGFEKDKSASMLTTTNQTFATYDRYTTTASLNKPFTTGTTLGIALNRLSQSVEWNTTPANPPPSEQTLDSAGITLEQALLGNFFGVADRGIVNNAELTYQASEIARADELENQVLAGLRQFWLSYVAQESFREAVNSRDRYQKLVDAVKRKTSLGYSNPGDLPQVQAEFEGREQKVKTTSYEYLKSMEDLLTMLAIDPTTEIKFEIPSTIPPVPKLAPKKVEELRAIRSQKLRVDAAEENLSAQNSLAYPTLNFVGKAYTSGQGDSAGDSFSDLASGSYPKYYVGLRLAYNFGSGSQSENIVNAKLNRDLQSTVLTRQTQETTDTEGQTERRVQSLYDITLSSQRQKDFRERASQELNRSYSQGRTDISILITAMNNFFDSEVTYLRALGDYAISLNEWASVRDELIPDNAPTTDYKE